MYAGERHRCSLPLWLLLVGAFLANSGCANCFLLPMHKHPVVDEPRELEKISLPDYILEPPDILLIDALRLIPIPPYRIAPQDVLQIAVTGTLTEAIAGLYPVDPDGTVNLGATYGSVSVEGMTVVEAKKAIETFLKKVLKEPVAQLALAQSRALQQVRGEHLIRPDGTVGLGIYGSVHVAGLTLEDAKVAIEAHLSKYVRNPEVSVDVFTYNSKIYYVITDGGGSGEQVYRFPSTGNETVLDAISQINGLPPVSSRKRIWLTRPSLDHSAETILPVDWKAVTRRGSTATNYQVFPGDRIYVQAEPIITLDTYLARIISPIERLFGVTLLGNAVVEGLQPGQSGGGGGGGF